jgi:hypothetical protein
MCALGGGNNRCLHHNPVSKFVVKVVTVRAKAPEKLVNSTLVELSKEGKKLPSPAPEVVKNWVETERFAAQYDPQLSEHDRKIQLNRLDRAETENVSGGHFHAWKNLHNAVRSKMTQKIAAAGLLVGMSVSLVGCFANGNANNDQPVVPPNAPSSYGMVVGSGEKVETEAGVYEKITVNEDAPIYVYNNGYGHPEYISSAGWSEEDGASGQRAAVDYMVKEFVDSTALNGGDAAYQEWYNTSAKKYYSDTLYQDPSMSSGEGSVVLGNYNGNSMPNLIHDGTPREKTLDLKLAGVSSYDDGEGVKGLRYGFSFNAEYRVNDKEATNFASKLLNKSPEEFLNSPSAKDSVKDGTGENVYGAKGQANIVLVKNANNEWKILGFQAITEYDTSNFATDVSNK